MHYTRHSVNTFYFLLCSVSRCLHFGVRQHTNTRVNVIFGENQLRQKRIRKSLLYETIELAWLDYFILSFVLFRHHGPLHLWAPISHDQKGWNACKRKQHANMCHLISTRCRCNVCVSAVRINHKSILTMCLSLPFKRIVSRLVPVWKSGEQVGTNRYEIRTLFT